MVETKTDTDPIDDDSLDEIHRRLQKSGAANLTAEPDTPNAWDRVKLARHANRPYTLDYIELLFTDFFEIHGEWAQNLVVGLARIDGAPVGIVLCDTTSADVYCSEFTPLKGFSGSAPKGGDRLAPVKRVGDDVFVLGQRFRLNRDP